ncbi:hypothetical protein QUR47_24670, partial [Salmonella enterica]
GILCVAHSGNGAEVELPQITCGGKLSNFEFSTYCPPRTGLARLQRMIVGIIFSSFEVSMPSPRIRKMSLSRALDKYLKT